MNKIVPVLVLVLILGIVGISGCTSSDNTTAPVTNNTTNTSAASTAPVVQNNTTTSDTPSASTTASSTASASAAYIGNSNTHVFHLASCHYVSEMNSGNKVSFNTRQEAIDAGYRPCKVCNP